MSGISATSPRHFSLKMPHPYLHWNSEKTLGSSVCAVSQSAVWSDAQITPESTGVSRQGAASLVTSSTALDETQRACSSSLLLRDSVFQQSTPVRKTSITGVLQVRLYVFAQPKTLTAHVESLPFSQCGYLIESRSTHAYHRSNGAVRQRHA